jgi:two-component system nitrate/nitrite response regulator NarL
MKSTNDGSMGKTQQGRVHQQRQVKVLLADDHTMFREGLAGMLASSYADEVEVVGKTDTGEEAVALAREKNPDVVIMQVDKTLEKARDTLKRIREGSSSSPTKVIILTMFEEPLILREILNLTANAYIHKSASVEELFAIVRAAVDTQGEHVLVALPQGALELSEEEEEDGSGEDGSRRALLPGKRELEVLLLVARGMRNRQIASRLGISEATVKRHLANLYPKMGVSSRGEAARKALENEWFTLPEIEAAIDEYV